MTDVFKNARYVIFARDQTHGCAPDYTPGAVIALNGEELAILRGDLRAAVHALKQASKDCELRAPPISLSLQTHAYRLEEFLEELA